MKALASWTFGNLTELRAAVEAAEHCARGEQQPDYAVYCGPSSLVLVEETLTDGSKVLNFLLRHEG